ncbi:MAG: thymidine phosphorylase [Thermoanaerobacterales bacterium]|nr:thymidine phosphorylase [Thermoanaerobacterales bacterium]
MTTDVLDVIRTKRDGGELSDEQIRFFVEGYTAGTIADEQAAALCMAILLRDMGPRELATWTQAMIDSGERLDLSGVGRPTVDKHSTGGVGDKVSLALVPLVAACGAAVPQLSGRGLGHTGGTLDKMEAIPGWRATLPAERIVEQLRDVGAVICAASESLCPADRKLYALRDVTATVEAIPLIASSIMSKKIAEGTEALVLDVKVGSGAFLPELDRARRLAETMVELGRAHGVRTVALITDMDTPLGRACGNALEVAEAVEVLDGGGPPDLVEVTLALATEMCRLAGLPTDGPDGPAAVLADGRARAVWDRMVAAQGGDPRAPLPEAPIVHEVRAPAGGHLRRLDARAVGVAVWRLGAGRSRKEDPVSPSAGAVCLRKPGDRVEEGEPLLLLHADDEGRLPGALAALEGAIEVGPEPPAPRPLVVERIG